MENEMNDFEQRLKRMHEEMTSKRKNIVDSRFDLHMDAPEQEERAANHQMAKDLERLDIQGERRILAIEKALRRLYSGEYTTCEICLDEIPFRRLEVLPWADRCIECAEKEENSLRR